MSSHKPLTPVYIDYHLEYTFSQVLITATDIRCPRQLILGLTIPGLVFVVCLLLAFGYTAWNPTSRGHLNRVSFRLLVYAMISNLIFDTMFFFRGLGPGAGCTFLGFLTQVVLLFSACMFFCMALNLHLVLVNGIDGRTMEKYYLTGSLLLVAVCAITPLAAGQFGYHVLYELCWFDNPNPVTQLHWQIGVQSSWILAMASLEVVLFLSLVLFMIRVQRRTSYARSSSVLTSQSHSQSVAPIMQYRGIIMRIGLYPLLSCILNFLSCVLNLETINAEKTELSGRLNLLSLCLFILRAFLYACLAATDPSFLRALRSLRKRECPTSSSNAGTQIICRSTTRQTSIQTGSVDTRKENGPVSDQEQGLHRNELDEETSTDGIICQM
ncbi:hypothetical protein B0H11DRAFT_63836 [Mycena galericulata]|nr:hypothetical protein B0H11DRAFT_63836 [Mycena galericulata]